MQVVPKSFSPMNPKSDDVPPMVAAISKLNHDLRSPLSAILGFAALLDDAELTAAERIDYVAAIRRAADQILAALDSARAAAVPAKVSAPAQPRIMVSQALVSRHVLLADDEPRLRQLTQFCLEKSGAKVSAVRDGREAVDRALAGQFDVVLMDMEMPEMDGFDATRQLRDRGYTVPIVAFTAHAGPDEWRRCQTAGCTRWVTKPFEAEKLVQELALAIESPNAVIDVA